MIKKIKVALLVLCVFSINALAVFNSDNPFDIKQLTTDQEGVSIYDKHHPFLGLFGAGYANLTPEQSKDAFTEYYNFCKANGNGVGADLGDFDEDGTPKNNFKKILAAVLIETKNPVGTYKVEGKEIASANANDGGHNSLVNEANLSDIFNSWKNAFLCDQGYFKIAQGFTDRSLSITTDNMSIIDANGNKYKKIVAEGESHYLYCYDNETLLNRDLSLFLSKSNADNIISRSNIDNAERSTVTLEALFFSPVTLDNDRSNRIEGMSFYVHNIQALEFYNSVTDNSIEELINNRDLSKSGLGYYCGEIHALHNTENDNATNKGSIETCIKSHVSAVIDGAGFEDGICAGTHCDNVTIDSTTVKGTKDGNGVYDFSSFKYCSNDNDFDGAIVLGGAHNWGTFDNSNDIPDSNTIDACPTIAALQETKTFFVINDGNVETRDSCTKVDGDFDTREEAQAVVDKAAADKAAAEQEEAVVFEFSAINEENSVVIKRNQSNTNKIKELRISSENSTLNINGISGTETALVKVPGSSLQVSKDDQNKITAYCFMVKGNSSNLTKNYLLRIPAVGDNKGVIETYEEIDSDELEYQRLSLSTKGAIERSKILKREKNSTDCSIQ